MGSLLWLYQFHCFLLFFHLHFLVTCSSSLTHMCPHDQSLALLQFKHSLSINSSTITSRYCKSIASYPKTNSWKESTDCCSWDGVTCDSLTGHVIGLDLCCSWLYGTITPNSSLFLLPHLKSLNLAVNDFRNSRISSQFGWFACLTHLNLSYSFFSGQVPSEISHLSRLISLDLSNWELRIEPPILKRIIQNLTEVRELFLDEINMSSVAPGSLINLSSSLTSLSLYDCQLRGNFPTNVFYRPKLQLLDLFYNRNLSGYFPKSNWSSPLEWLVVSDTLFSGELPDSIGNLKFLKFLDLSWCNFTGSIPSSLKNLEQLTLLDLSFNNFFGEFPESIGNLLSLKYLSLSYCNFTGSIPSSLRNLEQLTYLGLSNNTFTCPSLDVVGKLSKLTSLSLSGYRCGGQLPSSISNLSQLEGLFVSDNLLNGTIPSWLYTLPSLQVIDLSNNQLTGHVNEFQSKSLIDILLANNKLDGALPRSIFELVNLTTLYLGSNNFSGIVELDVFSRPKNLEMLDLSYNRRLSLSTNIHVNYTLPKLLLLQLSSCNISEFPNFLRASQKLEYLDLSNNKIGKIPNFLTSAQKLPWKNLRYLDLHSNLLQGAVPIPPLQLRFFSVSQNKLYGEIPSLICNASSLEILDLSHNNLSGTLPRCFGHLSKSLSVLDLQMNNFDGTIPTKFSKDCGLRNLNFHGNQLEGLLPRTLVNCRNLEVLDLGNNKMDDKFPHWLGSLPELQVLILRYNKFHGYVQGSKANRSFPKLQIFDLSNNDFEGPLPTKYIKNFKAMINVSEGKSDQQYMREKNFSYYFSVSITMKGFVFELEKILTIFTSIDLSKNRFEGDIPEVIGRLSSLKGLNLSHNNLGGHIPPMMGNLTNLEWLDLSSNKLVGEIPGQLADLTSLAVLKLSHNQLVGTIPQGKQFNTFNKDAYEGNLGLCGFPLTKNCSNVEPQPPPQLTEEDGSASAFEFGWKVVLMGYGCGMVFGLAMGYFVFQTGKPKWFVMLVEGGQLHKAKRSKKNARRSGGRRN